MKINVTEHRPVRSIEDLGLVVSEVDSSLEAICELLHLANGAKVHACGIHALIKPLQRQLSSAASALNDLST